MSKLKCLFIILCIVIIFYLLSREKFIITDTDKEYIYKLKEVCSKIYPPAINFNINPGNESVTIDKKIIYICLKDKYGNYYAFDILLYVTLHEIAHVMSKSFSPTHNIEFKTNFEELLKNAYKLGYLPKDIADHIPANYCSVF